jgi:hypothetical protein
MNKGRNKAAVIGAGICGMAAVIRLGYNIKEMIGAERILDPPLIRAELFLSALHRQRLNVT